MTSSNFVFIFISSYQYFSFVIYFHLPFFFFSYILKNNICEDETNIYTYISDVASRRGFKSISKSKSLNWALINCDKCRFLIYTTLAALMATPSLIKRYQHHQKLLDMASSHDMSINSATVYTSSW